MGLSRWSVLLGYWTSPLGMWGSWRFRAMRTKAAKHDRLTWTVSTWSATWNSAYICVHKFPWIVILRMSWRSGPRRVPVLNVWPESSKVRWATHVCFPAMSWANLLILLFLWTLSHFTVDCVLGHQQAKLQEDCPQLWQHHQSDYFHSAGTTVVLKHGFSCLSFSMKAFSLTKNKLKQSSWPPCLLPPISKHIIKLALNFNVAEIKELCHHLNI